MPFPSLHHFLFWELKCFLSWELDNLITNFVHAVCPFSFLIFYWWRSNILSGEHFSTPPQMLRLYLGLLTHHYWWKGQQVKAPDLVHDKTEQMRRLFDGIDLHSMINTRRKSVQVPVFHVSTILPLNASADLEAFLGWNIGQSLFLLAETSPHILSLWGFECTFF